MSHAAAPCPPNATLRRAITGGLVCLGLGLGLGLALPAAHAQTAAANWPQRPVRLVVPFPAGGGIDIVARLVADKLNAIWDQPIIVDNRPGANTLISAEYVLNARDEHTLLVTNSVTFTLPYVSSRTDFKPLASFKPVSELIAEQLVLVTPTKTGIENVTQLLDKARAEPGKLAYGSYSVGSIAHLLQDNLARKHNINFIHIPYKGTAPMMPALLGGEIVVGVSNYGTVRAFVEDGRMRPLAVFGGKRSPFLPDVPTLTEAGIPGFEANQWIGVFAPASFDDAVVKKIAADMQTALHDESLIKALGERALMPGRLTQADFGNMVRQNAEGQGGMAKAAGIRLN